MIREINMRTHQNYASFITQNSCICAILFVEFTMTEKQKITVILKFKRLMRVMKVIKEKNKFLRYFNETFKLNSGIERFIISILAILLFCHLVACI